jgi:hypothetical protein
MMTLTREEIKRCKDKYGMVKEYPIFNECSHTMVDLSEFRTEGNDWKHTFSVKLPNGRFVTMCVMQPSEHQSCVDVKYHGDNISTRAVGFKDGTSDSIKDKSLYTVICDHEEEE